MLLDVLWKVHASEPELRFGSTTMETTTISAFSQMVCALAVFAHLNGRSEKFFSGQ